jgi:ribonuclease BN (tRNA processing enzyme)
VLLDCGGSTSSGGAALGIERDEVDAILLTHFHADHFGGIPLLLLGAHYVDHRRRPLCVAGPRGVEKRVLEVARALGHSLEEHRLGFELRFEEIPVGETRAIGPVEARSFSTFHSPDSPHGLVVSAGQRHVPTRATPAGSTRYRAR